MVVVAQGDEVVAWASAPPYRERAVYEGVREFSVYVARERRGEGLGRAAMASLIVECTGAATGSS
jgi:L-amino acid N-acyltransferase YncA